MRFLKNNVKLIIGFIVGVILAGGITVYAYSYFASDVQYKNNKSVEDALNDLYNIATYKNIDNIVPLIPTMTSNNSPSGIVTTNAEGFWNNYTHYAYKAFDGVPNGEAGCWGVSGIQSSSVNWIQYEFDKKANIYMIELLSTPFKPVTTMGKVEVLLSKDGNNYDTIIQNTAVSFGEGTFIVPEEYRNNNYKYLKIVITGNYSGANGFVLIDKIQAYGIPIEKDE